MNSATTIGVALRSLAPALLLSIVPLTLTPATAAEPGPGQWTIVATYSIPEGASGLAYDGTWLYCGIYGVNGNEVYRIDPATGDSTLHFTGPQGDAFGLTYDGQYLWTTDHPGSSSAPAVAMQLDWDGTLLDQIDLPAHYVSGIAYDGGDFWVARYYADPAHMFKVDAAGAVLDDFTAPDNQPWDLCLENGALWMADYWGDALYKIDPASGALLESHPSEGVDPAGVVWDGTHLWYCDNGAGGVDFLYKIDLQGGGTPEISIPLDAHDYGIVSIGDSIEWSTTVHNNGDADLVIDAVSFDPPGGLSCTALLPLTVPPAGNAPLPLLFAPTGFGTLDATATVASNDPVHPAETIALTGEGVFPDATIDIAQAAHDYGPVRVNANTRWFMEISNHGNEVLTITDLAIDDAHYWIDQGIALPLGLAPLETVQVGVWFSPDSAIAYPATLNVYSNDAAQSPAPVSLNGTGLAIDYPMGDVLWTYTIDTDFDNSPKAIISIPDVSGDGIADVIICSEDDYVRCFNGNASGTGDVLWEHEIYAGSVYAQKALQVVPDIDEDGLHDVVVGSAWGGRLIRAISGGTGAEIWTYDTRVYGDGGWVYQVDCRYDYNNEGTIDVLASTGDDGNDIGPKRVHCLNGLTGVPIWETPLGGPVFSVIGVEDFTGDGRPDVIAGASNESETQGRAVGLDGVDGSIEWSFLTSGTSVWALAQIGDVTADGVSDVIVGDFSGVAYGLDATTGGQEYVSGGLGTLVGFTPMDDVDGDGHPEVVPAHFSSFARMIGSQAGSAVWTTPLADKPASVARVPDVSGDGVNDVFVGTLFTNNRAYFVDGVDGAVLETVVYGTPVDAIGATPDITGDGSWEMVVGGRNGLVTCLSGGLSVETEPADINNDGAVDFQDLLLLLAAWGSGAGNPADINGDGIVGFQDLLLMLAAWT